MIFPDEFNFIVTNSRLYRTKVVKAYNGRGDVERVWGHTFSPLEFQGEVERLILKFARENRSWGYDRIAGALENLGYKVSDQSVGNILRRCGIPPAPEREKTTTWNEFIL